VTKKITQNFAKPIFCQNEYVIFTAEKRRPKMMLLLEFSKTAQTKNITQ
jgi:hypothetical protein